MAELQMLVAVLWALDQALPGGLLPWACGVLLATLHAIAWLTWK